MKRLLSIFALVGSLALAGVFTFGPTEVEAQNPNCNVTNVDFRTNPNVVANPNGDDDGDGQSNFQQEYFQDYDGTYLYIDVQTSGCLDADTNVDFGLDIYIDNSWWSGGDYHFFNQEPNDMKWFDVPTQDSFSLVFFAAETGCHETITDTAECILKVRTSDGNSQNDFWPESLQYDCDGDCDPFPTLAIVGWLSYGATHPNDEPGVNPGAPGGQATISSEAYLAPLPGLAGQEAGLQGFLQGLFNVLIVIAGILALLMIVIGAIHYVSADSLGGTETGRKMIGAAVMGLVIALAGWVLINTINPNLASNLMIKIPKVGFEVEGDSDTYNSGTPGSNFQLPSDVGLYCPGSGGSAAIPQIIDSFIGKVAYRWGGKGGALAAGQNFPLGPGETSQNPYMCTNDQGQKVPCNTFCPTGNACLDCSGFVNHVRQCSGSTSYATGTAGMIANSAAEAVDMSQLNATGTKIGEYTLVPGDLLIWNGHVVVYYGDGKYAESIGGEDGRQKGANIRIHNVKKYKKKITHIIKM